MKNFVKGLITNRFGIVLATLNLCYFASNGLTGINHPFSNFDKMVLIQNVPAIFFAFIPLQFLKFLFPTSYRFLDREFGFIILLFFVTLQWLFIGWMAKAIARRIQPKIS